MEESLMTLILSQPSADQENQLVRINRQSSRYGLTLTQADARALLQTRAESLRACGRIEFESEWMTKLITAFCDSPYLRQGTYAQVLQELVETFYYFKNESMEQWADDDLIALMRTAFDDACHGCVELLQGTVLEELAREQRGPVDATWEEEDEDDF